MPFTWPLDRTGFPALPDIAAADYPRKLAEERGAAQLAVTVMHALSGRQFGLQDVIARPCRSAARHGAVGVTSYLLSWEGFGWVSFPCGCAGACRQSGPNMIHLPGPVAAVTKVEIAGVPLNPAVWVAEGNVVYRREGPWPSQDLNRPLGDTGTWGVFYQRGIAVPPGVSELTGLLAREFLTAVSDDASRCRLPRTVTTVSRQGVTYRAYDPAVIYANGKTGLPEIDLWLASINPNHLAAAPTVL